MQYIHGKGDNPNMTTLEFVHLPNLKGYEIH